MAKASYTARGISFSQFMVDEPEEQVRVRVRVGVRVRLGLGG